MCGLCAFPKICVIYRQTDVFIGLDMRASSVLLLAFIFTAAEYPLHIFGVNGKCKNSEIPRRKYYGETPDNISNEENSRFRMPCIEGYLRKAGTSNLFKCLNKSSVFFWENDPSLECIPDPRKPQTSTDNPTTVANTLVHKTAPNLITSIPSTTEKSYCTTMEKPKSTSAISGQTAFTTHTIAPTTGTSHHTTLRTTTKEEEPMTTANSITLSSSATLTVRENLTTVSSQSTSSSSMSTTTNDTDHNTDHNTDRNTDHNKERTRTDPGTIAAGTVLMLIVVVASAAGIFLWCRRSMVERTNPPPGSDQPLLNLATSLNSCPDSVQCSALPMENSPQDFKTDPLIVVQQA